MEGRRAVRLKPEDVSIVIGADGYVTCKSPAFRVGHVIERLCEPSTFSEGMRFALIGEYGDLIGTFMMLEEEAQRRNDQFREKDMGCRWVVDARGKQ